MQRRERELAGDVDSRQGRMDALAAQLGEAEARVKTLTHDLAEQRQQVWLTHLNAPTSAIRNGRMQHRADPPRHAG